MSNMGRKQSIDYFLKEIDLLWTEVKKQRKEIDNIKIHLMEDYIDDKLSDTRTRTNDLHSHSTDLPSSSYAGDPTSSLS